MAGGRGRLVGRIDGPRVDRSIHTAVSELERRDCGRRSSGGEFDVEERETIDRGPGRTSNQLKF